jgi:putative colanic acid biosysnthesis UDP-glucose lipid carrier transferase
MKINERPLLFIIGQILNPLVAVETLILIAQYYGFPFEGQLFILALFAFLVVVKLLDTVDLTSSLKAFWAHTVGAIFLRWFIVVTVMSLIGYFSRIVGESSRELLVTWFIITPFMIVLAQLAARYLLDRVSISDENLSNAVIVSVNDLSMRLATRFAEHPVYGVNCLGFFDDRDCNRLHTDTDMPIEKLLGKLSEAADFVKSHQVNQVYIAAPMTDQPRIMFLLDELRDTTVSIYFVPDVFLYDLIQANISAIQEIPIVAVCETPFAGINGLVKRISDVVLSMLILILISPLLLLISLGVKLDSKGPVVFKQRRYGLDGGEIVVYKFRSMTVSENGDSVVQATRNDSRITPFGAFLRKTSLDELPQFINVLQGRMSIVGPRPHAVVHNELYRKQIKGYMIRHKVKPGITGWAQVNGCRGETELLEKMEARIDFDLDYLRNWSLPFDFYIILRTICVVIKDRNAY